MSKGASKGPKLGGGGGLVVENVKLWFILFPSKYDSDFAS